MATSYADPRAGRRFDARTCVKLLRRDFDRLDDWEFLRDVPIYEFVNWERDRVGPSEASLVERRKLARLAGRLRRMRLKGRFTFPEYLQEHQRWLEREAR